MDWIWGIGIVVVIIIAALLWWLFTRNSSSTEAGPLAHAPSSVMHGPSDAAVQNPEVGRLPRAENQLRPSMDGTAPSTGVADADPRAVRAEQAPSARRPAVAEGQRQEQQPAPADEHTATANDFPITGEQAGGNPSEDDGGGGPAAASTPAARETEGPGGASDTAETSPSNNAADPVDLSEVAHDQERQARDTDADRPLGSSGAQQEHIADAMYEEEVAAPAGDEDLMVEETMPEAPGASGAETAGGAGGEEPPAADVEDAAAEQSAGTGKPLYDETEWLGYAGEAVIEPSVHAENGDGPDRKRS